jgi:hypothetical protein
MVKGLTGIAALVIVLVPLAVWTSHAPFAVDLDTSPTVFSGLLGILFSVAVLVERATEVVIGVFREEDGDERDAKLKARKAVAANAKPEDLAQAQRDVELAQKECDAFTAGTKQLAMSTGFVMGVLVAFAGVRALHTLIKVGTAAAPATPTGRWFAVVDILVTGAVVAGGSDGIHQMANVFGSFMDAVNARSDKATAQAKAESPPAKPA